MILKLPGDLTSDVAIRAKRNKTSSPYFEYLRIYEVCPRRNRIYFLSLSLTHLHINLTGLLRSTFHLDLYTAPSVSSISGMRSGTGFVEWRADPVANFPLCLLSFEIGELSRQLTILGKRKSPQGPDLENTGAAGLQSWRA